MRERIILLGIALTTGCATTLPAPPTQTAPHDMPQTLGAGVTEISAGGGTVAAIFDGSFPNGQLEVRHGVDDRTDVAVRATGGALTNTDDEGEYDVDAWQGLVALRVGLARQLVPRVLVASVGLGGGASGAGGFVGLDYGLTVGYDNPYVVPFLAGAMTLSIPVTRPTLDFTRPDDTTQNLRRAYTSFGFNMATGVRVPFGGHRSGEPHRFGFLFAFEAGRLFGDDPSAASEGLDGVGYLGMYAGLSHRFGVRVSDRAAAGSR